MLANAITICRVALLLLAVGLMYVESVGWQLLAFVIVIFVIYLDALDGQIARKYHQESELGGILDIAGDRIVENVLWICFAHQHLVSVWVPVIVVTRGLITDSIRGVALSKGMTAFGENTMMSSTVGKALVSSRFSRALYGVVKTIAFAYIILLAAYARHKGIDISELPSVDAVQPWWVIQDLLVGLTIFMCVIRGLPVIQDGVRLFKQEQDGAGPSP